MRWYLPFVLVFWVGCNSQQDPSEQPYTYVSGRNFTDAKIHYKLVDGIPVSEEDILVAMNEEDAAARRASAEDRESHSIVSLGGRWTTWPEGIVPYEIHSSVPYPERVRSAMDELEAKTPIRFVAHSGEADYVLFRKGFGCASWVGKQGGGQDLLVTKGCSRGEILHEIGHALGLWHEQGRADRDEFVQIHFENILPGYGVQFALRLPFGEDIGPYDYLSIMHSKPTAFSWNGHPTITKLDGTTAGIAQREGLTALDAQGITELYSEREAAPAAPSRNITSIANGMYGVCVLADSAVTCAGNDSAGSLGDGRNQSSMVPVQVLGMDSGVSAIASDGQAAFCALKGDAVDCWGHSISYMAPAQRQSTPLLIPELSSGVSYLSGGHGFAAIKDGEVYVWGYPDVAEVADKTPRKVTGFPSPVVSLTSGYSHYCALTVAGKVYCWGKNDGHYALTSQVPSDALVLSPMEILGLSNVTSISAGSLHNCALSDGETYCWGSNEYYRLVGMRHADVPTHVSLPAKVESLTSAHETNCAILVDGTLVCWGSTLQGTTYSSTWGTPARVDMADVSKVFIGIHNVSVVIRGEVKFWGELLSSPWVHDTFEIVNPWIPFLAE